ncbi:hypothetical protein Tco_0965568 [Tanacetum coccineum]
MVETHEVAAVAIISVKPNELRNDTTIPLVSILFYPVINMIRIKPYVSDGMLVIHACVCKEGRRKLNGRIQEMSQSLSSNVPDNSPEQEATMGHSIPRRLDSPTSQTIRDIITQPRRVTARLEDLEVEIDTLHADTEDKELLISELQDSLVTAENSIAMLQIRVADAEDRRAKDHDQI